MAVATATEGMAMATATEGMAMVTMVRDSTASVDKMEADPDPTVSMASAQERTASVRMVPMLSLGNSVTIKPMERVRMMVSFSTVSPVIPFFKEGFDTEQYNAYQV